MRGNTCGEGLTEWADASSSPEVNHFQSRSHQVVLTADGVEISCAEGDDTALPQGALSTGAVPYSPVHSVGEVIPLFAHLTG